MDNQLNHKGISIKEISYTVATLCRKYTKYNTFVGSAIKRTFVNINIQNLITTLLYIHLANYLLSTSHDIYYKNYESHQKKIYDNKETHMKKEIYEINSRYKTLNYKLYMLDEGSDINLDDSSQSNLDDTIFVNTFEIKVKVVIEDLSLPKET